MFTGHNDWQHPDVCKMSPVLMMHSERRPVWKAGETVGR